ncbi:MAG: phosphotransferase [Acidimicrobiales bacterium]
MTNIPNTIDDVTAEWVAEATGLAVTAIESEVIGEGLGVNSSVYRLHLQGDDVPETLVLKLKALDEAAVFTSMMMQMYAREVKFFDELADRSPIRVPKGYGSAVSDDGGSLYLLMEDMGSCRAVSQTEGLEIADAERAIDQLAAWHAAFWGGADRFVESGAALSLNHELYQGVLPMVFTEGWEKLRAEIELHPTVSEVAPQWVATLPKLLAALTESPTTICHGDYRADNILFDDNGDVVLLDFQLTSLGSAAYDVAYFVTQSLKPELAAEHERPLFNRYIAALVNAGIPESDTAQLWDHYRTAALFCLVYPIVGARGMDMSDDAQRELVLASSQGCARAIDDLDLRDLL